MTRRNPQTEPFSWSLDGGTAYTDYYRTYQNGRVLVVGVEGRNRPQPHQIVSFGVFDGETRSKIVEGPLRQHTFSNVQEALNFAENWFLSNCLTPMELMSRDLAALAKENSGQVPRHTWRLFTQPYPDINQWSVMIGEYRARMHVRRLSDGRYVIYRLDLQRRNHEDFRFKPADLETTYASEEEALAGGENWIYSQLSPMEILSLAAKENPRFRLDFRPAVHLDYQPTRPYSPPHRSADYEALHDGRHIGVWLSNQVNNFSIEKMKVTSMEDFSSVDGPRGEHFASVEEALEHCSNWYVETFLSPMDLLNVALSEEKPKKNPRPSHRRKYVQTKG